MAASRDGYFYAKQRADENAQALAVVSAALEATLQELEKADTAAGARARRGLMRDADVMKALTGVKP